MINSMFCSLSAVIILYGTFMEISKKHHVPLCPPSHCCLSEVFLLLRGRTLFQNLRLGKQTEFQPPTNLLRWLRLCMLWNCTTLWHDLWKIASIVQISSVSILQITFFSSYAIITVTFNNLLILASLFRPSCPTHLDPDIPARAICLEAFFPYSSPRYSCLQSDSLIHPAFLWPLSYLSCNLSFQQIFIDVPCVWHSCRHWRYSGE